MYVGTVEFDADPPTAHFFVFDARVRDRIHRKTVRTHERIDP